MQYDLATCGGTQKVKENFEAELNKKDKYYEAELAKKDKTISELSKKSRANTFNLDALNQYTRSENIKLHGIEYTTGENTNQILKDVGKYCGVEIKDSDISITHRLMSKEEMEKQINPANRDTKVPVIIARLNRRDIKTKLMEGRKNITTNTQCPENLKKVIIYKHSDMFGPRADAYLHTHLKMLLNPVNNRISHMSSTHQMISQRLASQKKKLKI